MFEVPPLPGRRTPIPVPLPLAPPTTKGGRGRSVVDRHDYIALERAAAVAGSRWRPRDPLPVSDPTYEDARIDGARRRWASLTAAERLRLVAPSGGSALLAVRSGGAPFVDWAGVLTRTSARIRDRFEPGFPHVHPHLHLLDTQRIYRDAYTAADPSERGDAATASPASEQF